MTVETLIFLLLSGVTLSSALAVVTTRNLFHAGLYLMVSLFGIAGLFVLLNAPFLAGVQVVVYIGAIAILIVLAVMVTPGVTRMDRTQSAQWPAAVVVGVLFFLLLTAVVTPAMDDIFGVDGFNADFTEDDPAAVEGDTVMALGEELVDPERFMLPFELASVLLMAALIGAVLLVQPAPDDDEPADETDIAVAELTAGPGGD